MQSLTAFSGFAGFGGARGTGSSAPPPVFTPQDVAQLVAAFAGDQGVSGGGATLTGIYGTSVNASVIAGGTALSVEADAVNCRDALFSSGAGKALVFSTDVLFTGDFTIYFAVRADQTDTTQLAVTGRELNNAAAIRISRTNGVNNGLMTVRVGAVAAMTVNPGRPFAPGWQIGRVSRVAGILNVYLQNELVGTSSPTSHAGDSIWNTLAYNQTGNRFSGAIGEVLYFDEGTTGITADEHNALYAFLETKWRNAVHINFAAGNDALDGTTEAKAKKTFNHVFALPWRPGQRFSVAGNTVHQGEPLRITTEITTALSTSTRPWKVEWDGVGTKPRIQNVVALSGSWSLVSGTIYKRIMALTLETSDGEPVIAGYASKDAQKKRLYKAETNAPAGTPFAGHLFYDSGAGELFCNIGEDPETWNFELGVAGTLTAAQTDAGVRIERPHVQVDGFDVYLWPGNGLRMGNVASPRGAETLIARNISCDAPAIDAFNFNSGFTLLEDCDYLLPGRRFDSTGSPSNGLTAHGTSGFHVVRMTGIGAGNGDVVNERCTHAVIEDSTFSGGTNLVEIKNQGAGAVTGSLTIRDSSFQREADALFPDGVLVEAGVLAGFTVEVTDSEFVGLGTVRGKVFNLPVDAVLTQSGNTHSGFSSLT